MISFKNALDRLESSKEFKKWKKLHKEAKLCYGFYIIEDKDTNWKIGYYHKKEDRISSFILGKKIIIEPEEEVFKKKNMEVKSIDKEKVKIDLAEAVTIANDVQKKEYKEENPKKIIAILQVLNIGQVWNITFLTESFHTLNFKIKSDDGKVVEKKLTNLFEFGK